MRRLWILLPVLGFILAGARDSAQQPAAPLDAARTNVLSPAAPQPKATQAAPAPSPRVVIVTEPTEAPRLFAIPPAYAPLRGGVPQLRAPQTPVPLRNLLFTPADAARFKDRHPLLTPDIRMRVRDLPVTPAP